MSEETVQTDALTNEGGPAVADRDWESEARAEGWRPKEEFKGPESKWIPAQEFVERGEKFAPIIKAKNRKLEQQIAELQTTTAQYVGFMNQQLSESRKRSEKLLDELREAKAKAIEDGNGKAVINFERQMEQVQDQMSRTQAPPAADPVVIKWRSENTWYGTDEDASDFADAVGYKYRSLHPEANPAQVLAHITEKVKARFPEHSDEPRVTQVRKPAGPEGGTARVAAATGAKKGPTLADLPDDLSRDIARRIIRSMGVDKKTGKPVMSEEDYMKSYNSQQ